MRKKTFIALGIFLFLIFGKFIFSAVSLSPIVFQLLFDKDITLKQSNANINILLLGIGGGIHEGPNLTDTIIFSSIDQQRNTVTLISIPRDLWITETKGKINNAYSLGEEKRKGAGITLARATVQKVVNKPIDYVLVVNFDGFIKALDLIGGITVTVDKVLDDKEYPIEGKEQDSCGHTEEELIVLATASSQLEAFPCRYKHIHFDSGKQIMDGTKALQFVRSRHAEGDEGTDFARSRRQAKIIAALKEKVFSAETLLNPVKLISLYLALSQNINADIKKEEIDDFVKLAQKMRGVKIQSAVLDYGDEKTNKPGLLVNPPISGVYGNQWVLIPRTGKDNFLEIQEYVKCVTTKNFCPIQ